MSKTSHQIALPNTVDYRSFEPQYTVWVIQIYIDMYDIAYRLHGIGLYTVVWFIQYDHVVWAILYGP